MNHDAMPNLSDGDVPQSMWMVCDDESITKCECYIMMMMPIR